MTIPHAQLPSYTQGGEPLLLFHPDRRGDTDIHPLRGLATFGPYSRSIRAWVADPIRIAVICPKMKAPEIQRLGGELRAQHMPRERKAYLQRYEGFSKIFGIGLDFPRVTDERRSVLLPEGDLRSAIASKSPWEKLAEVVHTAIRRLHQVRTEFDIALLYLPSDLAAGFRSSSEDESADFDLHDSIKALCSTLQLPIQMLNDDALTYSCRCSVMWRLSLALYAKAGGIPWKLAGFDTHAAYVGLSYGLRIASEKRFVTCCSQIFDAKGTNLQFLLYETHDGQYLGDNPYLTRHDMRRVMARTLDLYQRAKGRSPARLVVHKTTLFTRDEIDGCIDALGSVDDLELLTISQRSPWLGIRIDPPKDAMEKGRPSAYPVERGAMLPLSPFEFLLWTQGNCNGIGNGNYFKEGKGIPHPVRITRALGSVNFQESAREILGLTKMNWNNDSLYDVLPVTVSYASVLARIVKRMGSFANTPYDFRYFM